MFFFLRNSSVLFPISRSSSFSVIHVIVNVKNNAAKDTTLFLFFLSKSPGGHVISFQIKPWVAFGLPYLLIELFYVGVPVVRTDDRSLVRLVYGHVITKFSQMGRLRHFLSYGALRAWSSAKNCSNVRSSDTQFADPLVIAFLSLKILQFSRGVILLSFS